MIALIKLREWIPALVAERCGVAILRESARLSIVRVELLEGVGLSVLRADPTVLWAEEDVPGKPELNSHAPANASLFAACRWYMAQMGIQRAWRRTTGSPDVLTMIIDTGILWRYYDEPQIAESLAYDPNQVFPYMASIPAPFQWSTSLDVADATLAPWPDIYPHYTNSMMHGTQVYWAFSGAEGSSLVAPGCTRGYIASAPTGVDGVSHLDMLEALYVAADLATANGKKLLLSISWTWWGLQTEWAAALAYVWAAGGLVFGSAGNVVNTLPSYSTEPIAPANHPNVVAVGGIGPDGVNYGRIGPEIDVLGPYYASMYPGGRGGGGTSYACPIVMSAAALIWSANLELTNFQVAAILKAEATPVNAELFPNAGFPRIERAVLHALSLNAANAGVIYPSVEVVTTDRATGLWDLTRYEGTTVRTRLHGQVTLDVKGYAYDEFTAAVELRVGATVLYSGPPGIVNLDLAGQAGGPLTVTITTHLANSVTVTYDDLVVASGDLEVGGSKFIAYEVDEIGDQPSITGHSLRLRLPGLRSDGWSPRRASFALVTPDDSHPIRIMTPGGPKAIQ